MSLGMGLWYRLRSGTAWNRYRWSGLPVYRQSDGNAMIDTMKGEREGVIRARLPSPVRTPATNHARSPRAAAQPRARAKTTGRYIGSSSTLAIAAPGSGPLDLNCLPRESWQ